MGVDGVLGRDAPGHLDDLPGVFVTPLRGDVSRLVVLPRHYVVAHLEAGHVAADGPHLAEVAVADPPGELVGRAGHRGLALPVAAVGPQLQRRDLRLDVDVVGAQVRSVHLDVFDDHVPGPAENYPFHVPPPSRYFLVGAADRARVQV